MATTGAYFFREFAQYDDKAAKKTLTAEAAPVLRAVREALASQESWSAEVIQSVINAVAEQLQVATARISVELVFRGLSHYAQAVLEGETSGVVAYLVRHAPILGVVKRHKRANLAPLPPDPLRDYHPQLRPPAS